MKATTLFFILILSLSIKANATNYYFSSTQGDDSRTSTQAQNPSTPWKSIDKLDSIIPSLLPGDQVLFKSGDTFYGSIVTKQSGGTSSAPITFSSYGPGAKPVISGFTTITNWTSLGNGIYESRDTVPTNSPVNMVVINGKQYAMGRYPNVSSGNGGYLNFESFGANYITDNENPLTSNWIGAQLVVRSNHFIMERSTITDVSGNNISYSPAFAQALHNNYGYFVQNDIKTLDQFGEWYYNPNTKKIDVYFGSSNPNRNPVQVSTKDILLTLQSNYIVVNNLTIRGANNYGIWGDWDGRSNLQVKNCSIDLSGNNGIALANRHDFVMDNTTITNSNSVGISFYYNNYNPVVKNSTIRNSGTFPGMLQKDAGGKYAIGLYSSEGLTATNNTVTNSGYCGIMFFGDNNLVQNNLVDTFCTVLDDGGGIYVRDYGQPPPPVSNLKITGNIVLHGIGAKAGTYESDPNYVPAEGIYLDDNAMNVQVLNNTAAYCADNGIYVHNANNYTLTGNILFDNKYRQLAIQHDNSTSYPGVFNGSIMNNQFFAQSSPEYVIYLSELAKVI